MRLFKFWNADGVEKEKEEISLKKATRAVQGDFKDKMISVEYISKKGKQMCHSIVIPIGRKLRQSILQEQRRLALKAKKCLAVSRKGDTITGHVCASTTTLDTPSQ